MSRRCSSSSTPRRVAAATVAARLAAAAFAAPARADQAPTVAVGDVTVTETDSGTTAAVFTVTLSRAVPNKTTVTYSTSDSSARAPGDYAPTSGQFVLAAGATTRTVSVDVVGDTRYEGDESFSLTIGSPNAGVADSQGVATIVDDDPRPYVSVGNATVTEGNTGTTTATFPVTLDRPSAQPVRVRYATSDGSAVAGDAGGAPADYAYTRGTLTIPAGQTAGEVAVPVTGDTYDEGSSEYFYLGLSAPAGAIVFGNAAVGTIVDDEGTPLMSVLDSAVVEGNSGSTTMTFTVTLSAASPRTVTAFYGTGDGTAVAADYTPRSGSVVFTPGQTSRTITVPVTGDTADEGNAEYLNLYLGDVSGAALVDGSAYGEIVDDDPTLSAASFLTVDTASVVEPDTGQVNETFTVRLQPASAATVTVNYSTANGNAEAGADYTTTNGTLTFAPGTTSRTVTVPVRGDDLMEADETFNFTLASAVNAGIDDGFAYGYILNDDVAPVVTAGDVTVAEGDTGTTGDAAVEISLSAPTTVTASVVYTTGNSSAAAPGDYTQVNGTAVFQPGQSSVTVHVPVVGDTIDENDEGFYVYLSSPVNVLVPDNYGVVVITDDDRNPGISIDDPSVFEGTGGPSAVVFTVSLGAAGPNLVTVNYGTGTGSAGDPSDYTTTNGTLSFAPGETSKTVSVPVVSDSLDENSEYFYLYLGSPGNAYLVESYGVATVLDDDSAPLISIGEGAVQEPESGTAAMNFPVTLSAPSLNTVTVNYGTSDGNATAPGDYVATNGTLTFSPGQTTKTIAVAVVGDTVTEANEYISIYLNSATNAGLRDSSTYGTIWDTDWQHYLTVTDIGVNEGNSATRNASFTVYLNPPSVNTVTVSYGTADGSATAGGNDYTTTTGTLTFAAGQTSKTVAVPIVGDTVDENDEYFSMSLASPVNAALADGSAYATIFDDDPTGGGSILSIDDDIVVEGDSGTTDLVFPVTVTPAPTAPVTVNYRTSNSGAVSDNDYAAQVGVVSFAAGQTSASITVKVNGDTYDENDEAVRVDLFTPRGPATLGDSGTYGTILDDDRSPLVSIGDVSVAEGSTGTSDALFTVRLSQASTQPVQVDWDTRDGSAVAPGDYRDNGGTLSFAPGQTSKTVRVPVNGDDLVEGDEVFYVDLSSYVGGYRASSEQTGVATIGDSDAFALMGSVTLPSGAGVGGTTLRLTGNQQPAASATSAANGSFAFDDVPDGRYTLTPTATGRVFAPTTYTVDVTGGSITGLTFLSLTAPSISGRVTDADGQPLPGVTVTRKGNGQPDASATTNGAGWYGFPANAAGSYTVRPTGAGFTPVQRTVAQTATNNVTANFAKS